MDDGSSEERDRESYVRWQKIALEQLGYVINLFLTFAIAEIAFAAKMMMESKATLPEPARCMFHSSLFWLLLTVTLSLAANISRVGDFRYTRRAARSRCEKNREEHRRFQQAADKFGNWTWGLFWAQAIAFCVSTLLLFLSIWIGYSNKI